MNRFDRDRERDLNDFELPYYKQITVGGLAILFGLVLWFALTAEDSKSAPVNPRPTQTTQQQNITEQRITLSDGRSMMCLFFPNPTHAISCDWTHAKVGVA